MSRLIVKNLPKHYTLERFREHFGEKGEVTDAKLVKTGDGTFRRFAYVGYKTEKEAKAALKYFNNTYIDTSKIQVEFAKAIGDTSLARPWSRYSQGSSAHDRKTDAEAAAQRAREERAERLRKQKEETNHDMERKQKLLNNLYADKDDSKLKEFLEVMRPRAAARGRTWANDEVTGSEEAVGKGKPKVQAKVLAVANKKTGGDGMLVTKTHVTFEDSEDELYDELPPKQDAAKSSSTTNEKAGDDEEEGPEEPADSVAHDSGMSDLEYMRSKMKALAEPDAEEAEMEEEGEADAAIAEEEDTMDVDEPAENALPAAETDKPAETVPTNATEQMNSERQALLEATTPNSFNSHSPARDIPPAEIIADTGRLFVKNLAYSCTEEDLHKAFEKFGPLSEVHIPIDKMTKKPKGYAFILFLIPEHAVKAFTTMDSQIFQGRILDILPGKEKPRAEEETSEGPTSFKSQKEKQRKATAGNEFSWNSLFMNSDAVAEAMAKKLGVRKSEILNPDAENMAVRLALAETHIIAETKKYLEDEGIDLNAFEKKKTRSKTVILVKNIPHSTEEEELRELFGKFGEIGRLVLPPTKTVALVEFQQLNEAKSAFSRLAYTKFKHLPLYLEWAPVGTFTSEFDAAKETERKTQKASASSAPSVPEEPVSAPEEEEEEISKPGAKPLVDTTADATVEDPDGMPVATLFVKNLNFDTTEAGLMDAFGGLRGLRSARVATKPDKKTGGKLSMGFGFLEFATKEDAVRCMKSMQNFELDGHKLQLKFSNAAAKSTTQSKKRGNDDPIKVTGTKLIVRNIPFEATKKDLRQLFSTFGQLKSVRIPSKMDGQHRGFGFIDFLTKQEAKSAFESLAATHLYGRHLVLEWAEDENSVEAMRSKTAKGFVGDGGPNKRRKIVLDEEEDDMEAD
ncbi:uncharacterized protein EV422DRAFT_561394 [Fimicolochytrium jonesii]|uniref:uncharacterized protein n=1 Tax=Fimicolochytrium jonesii TaxID=1396493 RepID=UPI0022FF3948|nr:uncharacterized protein EV422DRAFT_561394 [Fimicolochytrium jonesii]KAI8816731.1 hypothetical protein EV422DRAFT_561394 [Fimicolochytrium jonesii]